MRAVVALQQSLYRAGEMGREQAMRYEIVECQGQWIVRQGGVEVARYDGQNPALDDIARRLRDSKSEGAAALSMRFEARR